MSTRPKVSLGIWAFGPMVTRFVPSGYKPDLTEEPMPEKVHRAVTGIGDLVDDYEFHYPGEINRDNLDDLRQALDGPPDAHDRRLPRVLWLVAARHEARDHRPESPDAEAGAHALSGPPAPEAGVQRCRA